MFRNTEKSGGRGGGTINVMGGSPDVRSDKGNVATFISRIAEGENAAWCLREGRFSLVVNIA